MKTEQKNMSEKSRSQSRIPKISRTSFPQDNFPQDGSLKVRNSDLSFLCGRYGKYELVRADEESTDKYFDACLDAVSADELCEAWQLYHMSAEDVLKKILSFAKHGRGEVFYLLFHNPLDGVQVVGMAGINPLGDMGRTAGEIWFVGESLAGHKRFLVEHARNILGRILDSCPVLFNIFAGWNYQTLRLVKYLGFCVETDYVRAGRDKALFRSFYLTKAAFAAQAKCSDKARTEKRDVRN